MRHHHERLLIPGPAGSLQALYQPGDRDAPGVVVCHPHPLYGGTMRNKVVYWMARAFEDLGCAVVRFNFRGVEQSEGTWDDGRGESDDAYAVMRWLKQKHAGVREYWMAGFSFGCYAGLRAAQRDGDVRRMFAVAPAIHLYDFSFLDRETRPLTVVHGTQDEIVPYDVVAQWCAAHPWVRFHTVPGAGHFFQDHMEQMTACLLQDVRDLIGKGG